MASSARFGACPRVRRVLIVDDDQFLAETLVEILSGEVEEVETCGTGAEALGAVQAKPYGIVLVDVRLPDIGGIELLRKLREKAPDVDIVIVTGNASVHSAIEAMNLGATRYILKPCAPDELITLVRDLGERQYLRERNRLYLRRLEVQNRLSEALSAALGPEEVASAAVNATRRLAEVRGVAVLVFSEEGKEGDATLKPLAWAGMSSAVVHILANMPEVKRFCDSGRVSPEPLPGMVMVRGDKDTGSENAACPVALYRLRGREEDLGILAVMTSCDADPDQQNEDLLMAIANWVGVALERATLYHRLETAYADLKKAQRRLIQAEKLSAIGRLAAGLAHEVGTPLNIISGRAEYLLELAGDRPVIRQGLEVIVQQIDRISALIRQLLDFSREHTTVRTRVSVKEVLQAVLPLLEGALSKRHIVLEVRIPEGLRPVYANFNHLQQVFINLLVNSIDAVAMKFENSFGGNIIIDIIDDQNSDFVRILVMDNGQGIKEEHLDKVFDPFFSTKEVGAGTGLGLTVVYGIITDHGGTIDIQSEWGKGTTVTLTLPVFRVQNA